MTADTKNCILIQSEDSGSQKLDGFFTKYLLIMNDWLGRDSFILLRFVRLFVCRQAGHGATSHHLRWNRFYRKCRYNSYGIVVSFVATLSKNRNLRGAVFGLFFSRVHQLLLISESVVDLNKDFGTEYEDL